MPEFRLRVARVEDAKTLNAIYAPYVTSTAVTFEYEVPGTEVFAQRIGETLKEYPYLVAEQDGQILGYAYAHRLFARAAYAWNSELSVYVDREARHTGAGSALCKAVLALLKAQGVLQVVSIIATPNEPSEGLHRKLGFEKCSTFPDAGYKLGAWHDTVWYRMQLTPTPKNPEEITPFPALPKELVESVLGNGDGTGLEQIP